LARRQNALLTMRDIRKGYKKEKNLDALFVQICMLSLLITTIKRQILDHSVQV